MFCNITVTSPLYFCRIKISKKMTMKKHLILAGGLNQKGDETKKDIEAGEPIPGGIANGIIGTMIILGMAVVFAVPIGILCGGKSCFQILMTSAQKRKRKKKWVSDIRK